MSARIKSHMPPGTLAFVAQPPSLPSEEERSIRTLAAQGQRLKSMTSAAETLLQAASRLEKEVKRETTYWQETLSVADAGWSIRRIPAQNKHQLGVQLASSEAGPLFKPKGFVALNTRADGTSVLDERLAANRQILRVRLVSNGQVVGENKLRSSMRNDESIASQIRAARDSLFEQELFHEITVEAHHLTAYGVRWRNSTVHVDANLLAGHKHEESTKQEILVDLVPEDYLADSTTNALWNDAVEQVAVALRVLMLHVFRQRLQQRSKPPPLYSDAKRGNETSNILRPLLNFNNHRAALEELQSYTHQIRQILERAGVDVAGATDASSVLKAALGDANDRFNADDLVKSLSGPLATTVSLPLPSSKGTVTMEVRHSLKAAMNISEFQVRLPLALSAISNNADRGNGIVSTKAKSTQTAPTFYTLRELLSYLDFVLALDIAHNIIAANTIGFTAANGAPQLEVHGKGSKLVLRIGVSCAIEGLSLRWRSNHGSSGTTKWTADEGDEPLRLVLQRLTSP
jgi:mediator of RNA polymerase II transcription subunit 17, fungi type